MKINKKFSIWVVVFRICNRIFSRILWLQIQYPWIRTIEIVIRILVNRIMPMWWTLEENEIHGYKARYGKKRLQRLDDFSTPHEKSDMNYSTKRMRISPKNSIDIFSGPSFLFHYKTKNEFCLTTHVEFLCPCVEETLWHQSIWRLYLFFACVPFYCIDKIFPICVHSFLFLHFFFWEILLCVHKIIERSIWTWASKKSRSEDFVKFVSVLKYYVTNTSQHSYKYWSRRTDFRIDLFLTSISFTNDQKSTLRT